MKIYVFEGSWMLEVIVAATEEDAWEYLTTHDGTSTNGGTLEDLKSQWHISLVFDPALLEHAVCVGHYSG